MIYIFINIHSINMSAQIKINSIDLVGTWKYTAHNSVCICGNSLQLPTKLQIEKKNMFRNNVIIGECGHAFHEDCILIQPLKKCPNCTLDWLAAKTTNNIKYTIMN
jgi:hypothetical protein